MTITLQWWHLVPAVWTFLYAIGGLSKRAPLGPFMTGWLVTGGMATVTGLLAQFAASCK